LICQKCDPTKDKKISENFKLSIRDRDWSCVWFAAFLFRVRTKEIWAHYHHFTAGQKSPFNAWQRRIQSRLQSNVYRIEAQILARGVR
jgi:protoheme ferro-lyase